MQQLDERILEHLAEEAWSSPRTMAIVFDDASMPRIRERCKLLAHAELVHFLHDDTDFVEITGKGQRYLDGKYDLSWFDLPQKAWRDVLAPQQSWPALRPPR
jgi:hypothetical protein